MIPSLAALKNEMEQAIAEAANAGVGTAAALRVALRYESLLRRCLTVIDAGTPTLREQEHADRRQAAYDVLMREGWRYCDVPACNCNSWHRPIGGVP